MLRHQEVAVLRRQERWLDLGLPLVPVPVDHERVLLMQNRLVPTLLVTAALAGGAAYGIPALLEREAQDEALRELSRLVRSASVYYVKPKLQAGTSERAACAFPRGEIRTTLAASCCDPKVTDGRGRCDPAKIEWNRSLWSALRWQMNEPHQFVYEYKASGAMGAATFEVSAYGDQDCDGQYSTFRYVGKGSSQAKADDCVLTDTARFEAFQPGE